MYNNNKKSSNSRESRARCSCTHQVWLRVMWGRGREGAGGLPDRQVYLHIYIQFTEHTHSHTHTLTHTPMRGYKVSSLNKGIMEEVAKRVMDGRSKRGGGAGHT